MENNKFYLSFDCAKKTFAFIIIRLDFNFIFYNNKQLRDIINFIKSDIKKNGINDKHIDLATKMDERTKQSIKIIAAECVDLDPSKSNKEMDTVSRVRSVVDYVNRCIMGYVNDIDKNLLTVLVEFQMSFNDKSRCVSTALLTIFSHYDIHLVSPSLKNKIYFTEDGRHANFVQKYKNGYSANKAHALFNYLKFEELFDQKLSISNTLKGHIADAFLQIFGYIIY